MGTAYCILILVVLFSSLSLRDRLTKEGIQSYPFDKDNTLGLRGVLVIFIILHHWGIKYYPGGPFWLEQWGMVMVSVFLFISGYGLMKSLIIKGNSYLDGFLQKRLSKVLVPFLIATIAWCIFLGFYDSEKIHILISHLDEGKSLLPNSWFCIAIIFSYMAFYTIVISIKNKKFAPFLMSCVSIGYIILIVKLGWGDYWYLTYLAFPAGLFLACHEAELSTIMNKRRTKIFYSITGISALLLVSSLINSKLNIIHFNVFKACIYILLPLMVFIVINAFGGIKNRFLKFCGTISYEIYLIHGMFLDGVYWSYPELTGVHAFALFVVVLLLSLPAALLLQKSTNRINDSLFSIKHLKLKGNKI